MKFSCGGEVGRGGGYLKVTLMFSVGGKIFNADKFNMNTIQTGTGKQIVIILFKYNKRFHFICIIIPFNY